MEGYVIDPKILNLSKIGLAGITTIKTGLTRWLAVDLDLPLHHSDGDRAVGWIAILNNHIDDHTALRGRQAKLVAILDRARALFDDVHMGLMEAEELLGGPAPFHSERPYAGSGRARYRPGR